MAAITETDALRPGFGFGIRKLSWGAVFGGAVVALGVWLMLYALGLALGLSSINPNENISGALKFTGIWSILTPLVALFVGGWIAARVAGLTDRTAGVLHGAVLWGLTTLAGAFVLTSVIGTLVGGAVTVGTSAVSGIAKSGAVSQAPKALGIDTSDLVQPLNNKLRAEGKPPVTAEQLQNAVQGAVGTSLREGKIDGTILQQSIAQNTNLSQEDVRELSATVQQRAQSVGQSVQQGAVSAASGAGKAFWGVFFALILGLISCVLGAAAGVAGARKHEERVVVGRRPAEVR